MRYPATTDPVDSIELTSHAAARSRVRPNRTRVADPLTAGQDWLRRQVSLAATVNEVAFELTRDYLVEELTPNGLKD